MTHSRLSLIACLLLLGCLQPASEQPKTDQPPAPKSAVSSAVFFETFAESVENGNLLADHTQSVKLDCDKAMKIAGVNPPANYEATMAPYVKVNTRLDDALRAKLVADLRGLAK